MQAVRIKIMSSDLMIVESMRNGFVLRVVSVIIIPPVCPVVGIESGDAEGTEQLLPRDHEGAPGVVGVEQLGRNRHTDAKVWPQLVVTPGVAAVQ